MPSPMNKRRRISEDTPVSPLKLPPTPSRAPLPSYMSPTKASLSKGYPHLVPKSPARGAGTRIVSPMRTPVRRSIAPEGLTEVMEVNGGVPAMVGRKFMDIANEGEDITVEENGRVGSGGDEDIWTEDAMSKTKKNNKVETGVKSGIGKGHLSSEEEIEKRRGVLMKRLRVLRAECEKLEQQLDVARQSKQSLLDTQESTPIETTMYRPLFPLESELTLRQSLLRLNDISFSSLKTGQEPVGKAISSAAPKKLKNPLPLLRFIHPLTFYSTNSTLVPIDDVLIRQYRLNGYALDRELYFEILMSVNEKQEQITNLQIKTSPSAQPELSSFLQRYPNHHKKCVNISISSTCNAQIALTALSTYAKLSSQRSSTFSRLATDLSHLLPAPVSSTLTPVSRKGKERAGDTTRLPFHRAKKLWTGERAIAFQHGPLGVVVSWDIVIDAQGFAGTSVSIVSKVPLSCTFRPPFCVEGKETDL